MEQKQSVTRKRRKSLAADLAEIALFVALMAVSARVSIPFPFMPLTFQTVLGVLAGLLLGAKKGGLSMLIYMGIGLAGLPVFTAGGGIFYVLNPSFGYIIGFIASAVVGGLICRDKTGLVRFLVAALAAFLADYAVGIAYFIGYWQLSHLQGLGAAVATYNLIYMPKDLVLSILAALLAQRLAPVIRKLHA